MKIPTSTGFFEFSPEVLKGLELRYPHARIPDEICKAALWLEKRKAKRPVSAIRFMENWLKKVRPAKLHIVDGRMTEYEMLALGQKLGIQPRAGESWPEFGRRLKQANP